MKPIKKHLLVVDDDPALRTLFQILLRSYGYTSETAKNGEEALTRLAQADYDGAVLDYMMPGITGLKVLKYIRQHQPAMPVVMITGHVGGHIRTLALAAGARACLYKPFDCQEFEQALKHSLGTTPEVPVMSEPVSSSS